MTTPSQAPSHHTTETTRPAIVIRIDKGNHRRTCECQSYEINWQSDERALLTLYSSDQPDVENESGLVSVEGEEIAYIMASRTMQTIEVVSPARRREARESRARLRTTPGGRK